MSEEIYQKNKIIPLHAKEIEEYEINNNNIGEVEISGIDNTKNYKIIFELSKEAMIGFGIHCIKDIWITLRMSLVLNLIYV